MKDPIQRLHAEWKSEHCHIAGTSFHPLNDPPFEARAPLKSLALHHELSPLFEDALEVMTLARERIDLDSDAWRYGIEAVRQHKRAKEHLGKGSAIPTAVRAVAFSCYWPNTEEAPDADLLALFALGGGWWALKYLAEWAHRQEERLIAEGDEVPPMLRCGRRLEEDMGDGVTVYEGLVLLWTTKPDSGKAEALERFAALVDPAREALGCPLPHHAPALATRKAMLASARQDAMKGNKPAQQEREARAEMEEYARQLRRRGGQATRKTHRPYKAQALVAFRALRFRPDGRVRQLQDLTHRILDHLEAIPPDDLPADASLPAFDTLKRWLRPHWQYWKAARQKGG